MILDTIVEFADYVKLSQLMNFVNLNMPARSTDFPIVVGRNSIAPFAMPTRCLVYRAACS